jgi:hypothetical protein
MLKHTNAVNNILPLLAASFTGITTLIHGSQQLGTPGRDDTAIPSDETSNPRASPQLRPLFHPPFNTEVYKGDCEAC